MINTCFYQNTTLKSFFYHADQISTSVSCRLSWGSQEHQKYLNGFSNISLLSASTSCDSDEGSMWNEASLVAKTVKNLPTMQDTWVWSLGCEDSLEEGMATHSSILAWRIPMDRGAWQATVHGVADLDTIERLSTAQHVKWEKAGMQGRPWFYKLKDHLQLILINSFSPWESEFAILQ